MRAGRHHPEEQGLKRSYKHPGHSSISMPAGIIQKNKD